MKYTIEAVDSKVVETLEIQGNKFTATWEAREDDRPFCSYHAVGKPLDTQLQEAFEYSGALEGDVEGLVAAITFLPNKFLDFVEAWGE